MRVVSCRCVLLSLQFWVSIDLKTYSGCHHRIHFDRGHPVHQMSDQDWVECWKGLILMGRKTLEWCSDWCEKCPVREALRPLVLEASTAASSHRMSRWLWKSNVYSCFVHHPLADPEQWIWCGDWYGNEGGCGGCILRKPSLQGAFDDRCCHSMSNKPPVQIVFYLCRVPAHLWCWHAAREIKNHGAVVD